MKSNRLHLATVVVGCAALLGVISPASAQTAPPLGSAQSFAVLGGSTVTNTGPTVVTGNLGVSPGSSVTGFPPGIVVLGTVHNANSVALNAQNDVITAYDNMTSQPCTQDLTGQNLGGLTLTAGVYCFDSSAGLTGTLTLDAQGNAAAVFIFKIGSTLTTASASSVSVINGGSLCNVFWQVGSSATLGTSSSFVGNIIALTSITLTTGSNVAGRTLARNGAVTLDSNSVTATCLSAGPPAQCPTVTVAPPTIPNGTVGTLYSEGITASGGTAPYTFTIVSGALPPGLTLAPALGQIVGTPTAGGTFTFTVRATDARGCFGELPYTMSIIAVVPTLPQAFTVMLGLALAGVGYVRLRRRARAE